MIAVNFYLFVLDICNLWVGFMHHESIGNSIIGVIGFERVTSNFSKSMKIIGVSIPKG